MKLFKDICNVSVNKCAILITKTNSLQSYDATTHFESTVKDVIAMYKKITGKVSIILKFNALKIQQPSMKPACK